MMEYALRREQAMQDFLKAMTAMLLVLDGGSSSSRKGRPLALNLERVMPDGSVECWSVHVMLEDVHKVN